MRKKKKQKPKYHTVGTVLKLNQKIPHCQNSSKVESENCRHRDKINTNNTQLYYRTP